MSRKISKMAGTMPDYDNIKLGGIGLAAKLVIEHKYSEARKVLTKVLEFSPNDVEIMTLLANIYIIERKLNEAEALLDKALLIDPDYPSALYNMGVVYGTGSRGRRSRRESPPALAWDESFDEYPLG